MTAPSAPLLTLAAADGAAVEISPAGAQVCRWRTPDGVERLFLSERAVFAAGSAIRGGVPVIFPQFGAFGTSLRHGFARLKPWQVLECGQRPGEATAGARFALTDDDASRTLWPHAFALELTVRLGGPSLQVGLTVRNTGTVACAFTAALHTYIAIDALAACRVHGLQHRRFLDNTRDLAADLQSAPALAFDGEVDRVYLGVEAPLRLADPRGDLEIRQSGFRDVVVWNPGEEKARALTDLPPDGHTRFICLEAAVVDPPVRLAPGESWTGEQHLTAPGSAGPR